MCKRGKAVWKDEMLCTVVVFMSQLFSDMSWKVKITKENLEIGELFYYYYYNASLRAKFIIMWA
jgi:hypothetical protein